MLKKLIILVVLVLVCVPVLAQSPNSIPFAPAVNYATGSGPSSVFCADLDGDGDLDLAVTNENSHTVSILKNNGDGTFQDKVDYGTGDWPISVFCADLDGDSYLDLAVANPFSKNVSILKNNGDGTFQAKVDYPVEDSPWSVFCADLDGDGDLDLAVANAYGDGISILKNNGDGTFQPKVDYSASNGSSNSSIFCADLDNDKDLDLAVANLNRTVFILKNNGNGTFQNGVPYGTGDLTQSVFCADLDRDSYLDLAVAYMGLVSNGNVSILKNNGNGTFQTTIDYAAGTYPASVFCANLDKDTHLDLAVANGGSNNVSILKNNGNGTFQNAVNYSVGGAPSSIFCADLDGDGDLDIVTANSDSQSVSVLINLSNEPPAPRVLLLRDGSALHNPIVNKTFKIYKVSNNPPAMDETYLGELTTDESGRITLPEGWFDVGDWVKVEEFFLPLKAVGNKNPLPYFDYIAIDNGKFDTYTGAICYHTLTPEELQEVILDHTTIMYDLSVSVEWDADQQYLEHLRDGFRFMSNYLYDVSDGQACLISVDISDDKVGWTTADVRIYASNVITPNDWNNAINVPRKYFGNVDVSRNESYSENPLDFTASVDYRAKAHEFGHTCFRFGDEYEFGGGTRCKQVENYGFMDYEYDNREPYASEMSSDSRYQYIECRNTEQYSINHSSCWSFLESKREKSISGLYIPIIKPSERQLLPGRDYFEGPNNNMANLNFDVGAHLQTTIDNHYGGAFNLIYNVADYLGPVPNAKVTLYKNNRSWVMQQGKTADNGKIRCLGVNNGDIIRGSGRVGLFGTYGYNEVIVGGSSCSNLKNFYRTSADGDTVEVILRIVQGNYRMNNRGTFDAENSLRYNLKVNKSFSQNPSLEFYSPFGQVHNYNFYPITNGYEVTVSDSLGSSGIFAIIALDDSGYSFFVNNNYTVTYLSDSLSTQQIYGPEGACELILDTLNTSLQKIFILSSDFPPLLNGLDSLVEQAGELHSISAYPNVSSLSGLNNYLLMRYSDHDLKSASESGLKIFKWNESSNQWEWIGGVVDTITNAVSSQIKSLGIYAAFTTALIRGDVNGDKLRSVSDVVYLINYLFKGGPAPVGGLLIGDVNCDGKVSVSDVVYLINYLFKGGPPPGC